MSHRSSSRETQTAKRNHHSDSLRILTLERNHESKHDDSYRTSSPEYFIKIQKNTEENLSNLHRKHKDLVKNFKDAILALMDSVEGFHDAIIQLIIEINSSKDSDFEEIVAQIESQDTNEEIKLKDFIGIINTQITTIEFGKHVSLLQLIPNLKYLLMMEVVIEQEIFKLQQQLSVESEINSQNTPMVTPCHVTKIPTIVPSLTRVTAEKPPRIRQSNTGLLYVSRLNEQEGPLLQDEETNSNSSSPSPR